MRELMRLAAVAVWSAVGVAVVLAVVGVPAGAWE